MFLPAAEPAIRAGLTKCPLMAETSRSTATPECLLVLAAEIRSASPKPLV